MAMPKEDLEKITKELKEWQDHQFTPGYWIGSRIPPWFKSLKRGTKQSKRLKLILTIQAFMMLVILGLGAAWGVPPVEYIIPVIILVITIGLMFRI